MAERAHELHENQDGGDQAAGGELFELLYARLRSIAVREMSSERRDHTLQPTALVHTAYVRMMDGAGGACQVEDHATFVRYASKAMRDVLVEHARARKALKRGDGARREPLDLVIEYLEARTDFDLLELHEALDELTLRHPDLALVVEMRFFGGLGSRETAESLGVCDRTVENRLALAKLFLKRILQRE